MKRNGTILAAAALIAIVFFVCVRHSVPRIERDISERVRAELAAEGYGVGESIEVSIDGRDVLLTGTADSAAARDGATDAVVAVAGVRGVTNELTVSPGALADEPAPTPEANDTFVFDWRRGGELTLRGFVADGPVRAKIVESAERAAGAEAVRDELEIAGDSPGKRIRAARLAIELLTRLASGRATVDREKIEIAGVADSREQREEVTRELLARRPEGYRTVISIDVATPALIADANPSEERTQLSADECQARLDQLMAGSSIEFAKNSSEIVATSQALLDRLAEALASCPDERVEISGHTDSWGPADWNTELSGLRAQSVADQLRARGISRSRLVARGYGSERPIADDATQSGRERNRRIELALTDRAGGTGD